MKTDQALNFPGFVISLRRAENREQQVQRIIDTCPVKCSRIDAVDGSQLSGDEVNSIYHPHLHHPRYPFELRRGEIGCFMSHRKVWQRIVDEEVPMALVLEDDVEFLDGFSDSLEFASQCARPGDYIDFQVRQLKTGFTTRNQSDAVKLVRPDIIPLRTSAQLVTLDAAKRLLHVTQAFDRPIDSFLQMSWITGVPICVPMPSNVIEVSADLGGSMIGGSRRPLWDRVRHETLRPIYRWRLASHARRNAA